MQTIREACWKEEALAIRYADRGHAFSDRTILPLAVMYTDRALTVLAWCCMRKAFRMFRTDRILSVSLGGTSFRPRRAAMLRTYLEELNGRKNDQENDGSGLNETDRKSVKV